MGADQVEGSQSEQARVGRLAVTVDPTERELERPASSDGQVVDGRSKVRVEEAHQGAERQLPLGAAGAPSEDPVAAGRRRALGERPKRALADPGLAIDRKRQRTRSPEDLLDRRALRVPPDDLERRRGDGPPWDRS
jgi:hypothetical protein